MSSRRYRAPRLRDRSALGIACATACSVGWGAPTLSFERVLVAIEQVESGGNPWVIHDNTADRSYFPRSQSEATDIARRLLDIRHDIDVGAMQINSAHFASTVPRAGFVWTDLFDPAVSHQIALSIFSDIYGRVSMRLGRDDDVTLWRAIGSYNGGERTFTHLDNLPYQAKVMAALGTSPPGFALPAPGSMNAGMSRAAVEQDAAGRPRAVTTSRLAFGRVANALVEYAFAGAAVLTSLAGLCALGGAVLLRVAMVCLSGLLRRGQATAKLASLEGGSL